jgi:ABC-type Fe3+/spermidine/putrescine transport system ATPase subunit
LGICQLPRGPRLLTVPLPGLSFGRGRGGQYDTEEEGLAQSPSSDGAKPSVELRSVSKLFGDLTAVDDLSLEIGEGEFFTLLGPSGCGKTTTLRMVAGFEEASSGQVLIDGADVAGLPPHKRPTNTVFQSYALFPHLSVADNVAFGLKRKGTDRAEIGRRVASELDRVGLRAEANRRPAQLSGGQQQRVAIARVLVQDPEVILADEPVSSVDPTLASSIVRLLIEISRTTQKTLLVSLHSVDLALAYFPRIVGVKQGKAVFDSSPDKVNDDMLEDLYNGNFRDPGMTEATSEKVQPIAYPSVG